jgi:hypothetical protein
LSVSCEDQKRPYAWFPASCGADSPRDAFWAGSESESKIADPEEAKKKAAAMANNAGDAINNFSDDAMKV